MTHSSIRTCTHSITYTRTHLMPRFITHTRTCASCPTPAHAPHVALQLSLSPHEHTDTNTHTRTCASCPTRAHAPHVAFQLSLSPHEHTHTHTHAHAPHAARQHTHLMSHSSCPCRPMSTHTHTHTHMRLTPHSSTRTSCRTPAVPVAP